jgi:hypothetical protein
MALAMVAAGGAAARTNPAPGTGLPARASCAGVPAVDMLCWQPAREPRR